MPAESIFNHSIFYDMKKYFVRAYRPYIVDYVWELLVPGANQKDAIHKVAEVMRDDTKNVPPEWVTKSGYDEDGAEMPCLHGHTGWEVLDKDSSDRTSIKSDTSGQRAFLWGFNETAGDGMQIFPIEWPCERVNRRGVLIAEPFDGPSLVDEAIPNTIATAEPNEGDVFFCRFTRNNYRVIWAFANP